MISDDMLEEIESQVMDGYYDRATIIGSLLEMFADVLVETEDSSFTIDDVPPATLAALEAAIDAAFARKADAMKSWPAITDCDRIREALAELARRGLLVAENCGVDRQGGEEQMWDRAFELEPVPNGFCFFHQQDVTHALDGEGLFLCFGTFREASDPMRDDADRTAGETIVATFRAHGFEVEWDGSPDTRIMLPRVCWQNRGSR